MKKISSLLLSVILILLITVPGFGAVKYLRQNELRVFVHDGGHQSENCGAPNNDVIMFYEGIEEPTAPDAYPQADAWMGDLIRCAGSRFGCRNWYDPKTGQTLPIKLSGSPYGTADKETEMFCVPDENGVRIKRNYRYYPPRVTVDGLEMSEPFPRLGDTCGANFVWGTADAMVESHFRTDMGLDIYQRVLVWAQKNHDDYVIYDWTVVNTGNVDLDDDVERDGMDIDSLYFMRQLEIMPNNEHWGKREWYHWTGVYPTWDDPEDSVRLVYAYGDLDFNWLVPQYDAFGCFDFTRDYLDDVCSGGEVVLYVPQSPAVAMGPNNAGNVVENYPGTDDVTQPRAHGIHGPDELEFKETPAMHSTSVEWETVYDVMKYGEKGDPQFASYVDYMAGTYPNTYHPLPMDRRGKARWMDVNEMGGLVWHAVCHYTSGPFDLPFGDSLRFVWATTGGTMPPQTCWDLGRAWKDSTITFVTSSGDTLDINDVPLPAGSPDSIYLPPAYWHYDWRWQDVNYACDRSNYLKDMWVYTTKDTVIRNAINAQWNFDHNYNISIPPAPPSVEVTSGVDKITVSWWYERDLTDRADDLAGFRVYRALGNSGPIINVDREYLGEWGMIYEAGSGESSFEDTTAVRGENYYYYVTAFDNGSSNAPGVNGVSEALESGRWQNNTYKAASLTRPPEDSLSKIRVVPNPLNITSTNMNYTGEPTKLIFVNLPPICTIRIYNFSGDLVKTIQHTDGSGDEDWSDVTDENYLTTDYQQVVASGLYIANISTPDGRSVNVKFVIVR